VRSAVAILGVLVLLSGFANIFVRHQHRLTFNVLQAHEQRRDQLNTEWHQLLLEQSTWSFQHFVERKARDELDMVFPETVHRLVVERQ
jgi:cell division protein FtsL